MHRLTSLNVSEVSYSLLLRLDVTFGTHLNHQISLKGLENLAVRQTLRKSYLT